MEIIKDHSATAQSSESRYEISMSHISCADAVSCSISGVLWSPSLRDKCHIKTSPPEAHTETTQLQLQLLLGASSGSRASSPAGDGFELAHKIKAGLVEVKTGPNHQDTPGAGMGT